MKKLIVFFLALFAVSCENKPQDDNRYKQVPGKFIFDNQSGVQVAVVIDFNYPPHSEEVNIPDSLVLQPNQQHSWDMRVWEFYTKTSLVMYLDPPLGRESKVKLYFDKTVLVEYVSPKEDRSPIEMSNYVKSGSDDQKYKKQWTYTFTVEDYQRAVEQNNK